MIAFLYPLRISCISKTMSEAVCRIRFLLALSPISLEVFGVYWISTNCNWTFDSNFWALKLWASLLLQFPAAEIDALVS